MAICLADVADNRDNNSNVLRLFAAGLILVSHSFQWSSTKCPARLMTRTLRDASLVAL
jgi:hypothetical protein